MASIRIPSPFNGRALCFYDPVTHTMSIREGKESAVVTFDHANGQVIVMGNNGIVRTVPIPPPAPTDNGKS